MNTKAFEFLQTLCETPTPTGWELPGQRLIAKYVRPYADEVKLDVHGNLHAVLNPGAKTRILLDGHCDEIGLMVQYIDSDGFLFMSALGGVNIQLLPGERVVIQGRKGPVNGVVGNRPIHLIPPKDRDKGVSRISDLWVDIGASSAHEAADAVEIGAPAVIEAGFRRLLGDRVSGRGLDDRVGAFIVMDVLRRVKGRKLKVGLHVVSSTQEEVGCLGAQVAAFGADPSAAIAVDVTFASDDPGKDERRVGSVKLGSGPAVERGPTYDMKLVSMVERAAEKSKIAFQKVAGARGDGTNAFPIRMTRSGVPVSLISVPLRYMHTPVETVSLADVDAVSQLIAETVCAMPANPSFGPEL